MTLRYMTMNHAMSLLGFAYLLQSVLAAPTWQDWAPTASIDSGVVVGTTTVLPSSTVTVNRFLGVPFAAPPVRFEPPMSPEPWSEPYDATEYKPACIQEFTYPEASREATIAWFDTPPPPAGESEDCLNLNVYAPASGEQGKAVMFWIYGVSIRSEVFACLT